jgi:hypothetical protein
LALTILDLTPYKGIPEVDREIRDLRREIATLKRES